MFAKYCGVVNVGEWGLLQRDGVEVGMNIESGE